MMLRELWKEQNTAWTENGAKTKRTTKSDCLDLFATIGALRDAEDSVVVTRFMRAYAENPDLAMRILFYARDIRGGLGERKVFRTILKWLAWNQGESVNKNIANIAEFGRFDDMIALLDTPSCDAVVEFISGQLREDLERMREGKPISLMAKWLPSVNASSAETVRLAKKLARALRMKDADYRKMLTSLRGYLKILENNLRERDYTFEYSALPSKALFKYRRAFNRNDGMRYQDFLNAVSSGTAKMHTGTLAPYDVIRPLFDQFSVSCDAETARTADVTWNALEDFTGGENALVIVDGSGSMYGGINVPPIMVALSLGIYFAERNTGEFQNYFITFSQNPKLVEIKGCTIAEKVRYCASFDEAANTNVQRVFELILNTAVKNRMSQEDMPSTLYFISDMEFDSCTVNASMTNFEYAKALFESNGYKLPQVVFWNVNSRREQMPVEMNEQGVILVSGASPRIFQMITGKTLSPYDFMLNVLNAERYRGITA